MFKLISTMKLKLLILLLGFCTTAFAQSDYYAKKAKSHISEAQQYLKKAENCDNEAEYYNNKAANYLREAECYARKGDYDRAAYKKWASDAADQAITEAKRANTARDNARGQMRWVKEVLDKAKR